MYEKDGNTIMTQDDIATTLCPVNRSRGPPGLREAFEADLASREGEEARIRHTFDIFQSTAFLDIPRETLSKRNC